VYWRRLVGGKKRPSGHAFNAVNRNGDVFWVDAQYPLLEPWPPRKVRNQPDSYDESDVDLVLATLRGGST
jgi:hypothetical protein